ncbi:MAG: enoyl-CoA hydratase/isomerase family protein [Calditrichaeota bacterium]|nr:enoyl-CoA hydratase/isomerase family protein [Calditrichota bacterium]
MSYQFIEYEVIESLAIIRLNRPDVLNSFNRTMAGELQEILANCAADSKIRAVYLTGNGRAFSAGQDLAEAAPKDKEWPAIADLVETSYNPIVRAIRELKKTVIAAVNGVAAGAGANIALSCDIVVAHERASFLQAFCHIGLIPDSGGTFFLPRLVGLQRATALTMLGEKISAEQALDFGLIYKVFSEQEFESESLKLANHLSTQATKGLGLIKQALNQSLNNDLNTQLELEKKLQAEAADSEDYVESVNAFLEKRKAKFRGK